MMKRKLLEIGTSDGRVREIAVSGDEYLVGRGEDCDLCLRDPEISRHHCLIRQRGQESVISDLGSSNGTYINGHRLLSQAKLNTGDEVVLGPFRYIVDLGDNPDFRLPQVMSGEALAATRTVKEIRKKLDEK